MHHLGLKYSVIKAANIAPVIPPNPLTVQEKLWSFSEPYIKSFLDWITIIESTTTSMKAVAKLVMKNREQTKKMFWMSNQKKI